MMPCSSAASIVPEPSVSYLRRSKQAKTIHSFQTATVKRHIACEQEQEATGQDAAAGENNNSAPWQEAIGASRPFVIESRMVWKVGDDSTRRALAGIKKRMHDENCHRDRHIDVTTKATLKDLVTYQVCVPPGAPRPGWRNDTPMCDGCVSLLILLFPMFASLMLYWETRQRGMQLITHTTYKNVYVQRRR